MTRSELFQEIKQIIKDNVKTVPLQRHPRVYSHVGADRATDKILNLIMAENDCTVDYNQIDDEIKAIVGGARDD